MGRAAPKSRAGRSRLRRVWRLGLLTFLLAAATGFVMRLVPLIGPLPGLSFDNLRHAHSHLMYFGWATPLLMFFLVQRIEALSVGLRRHAERIVWCTFVAAWASYLPFLLSGYGPTDLGGLVLPLSVLTASLNGLAWWWFAGWYATATRGLRRDVPRQLSDGAVLLLVVASIGALGRGMVDALGLTDAFARQAPIHAFLDLFSDGWFLLAVVALAWYALQPDHALPRWAVPVLVVGSVPVFLLTLPVTLVPTSLRTVAAGLSLGALLVLGRLLQVLWAASHRHLGWRFVLVFVGLRVVAGVLLLIPAVADGAVELGLRLVHLHVLGLGVLTGGLVAAAADLGLLTARSARNWRIAIAAVVASLLPLSDLWPASLRGRWALVLAAGAAALPVLATLDALRSHPDTEPDKDGTMSITLTGRWRAVPFGLLGALVVVVLADVSVGAQEQADGRQLFANNCASCHGAVGEGRGTAPPLAGNDRVADAAYVEEILRNGLTGPIEVNGQTYDDVMPSFDWMSDEERTAVTGFVAGLVEGDAEPEPEPTAPTAPVVGDAARGESLFDGRADLMAGGPSCAACHSAGSRLGGLGGTTLGPELTTAVDRFGGEAGLATTIANPPSPTMRPLYVDAVLTEQEIADLAAFLSGLGDETAATGGVAAGGDVLTLGGAVGLVALLALMALLWRSRHRHFLTRRSAR